MIGMKFIIAAVYFYLPK